jgi:hypothetical protein
LRTDTLALLAVLLCNGSRIRKTKALYQLILKKDRDLKL